MAAPNVRCAGGGDMAVIRVWGTKVHRTLNGEPCGWKGARHTARPSEDDTNAAWRAWREATRKKPCPRCGGRVELIPEGAR